MKANRNSNEIHSNEEVAMAEFHQATKECQNLTREMKRMTRARVSAAMIALVRCVGAAAA